MFAVLVRDSDHTVQALWVDNDAKFFPKPPDDWRYIEITQELYRQALAALLDPADGWPLWKAQRVDGLWQVVANERPQAEGEPVEDTRPTVSIRIADRSADVGKEVELEVTSSDTAMRAVLLNLNGQRVKILLERGLGTQTVRRAFDRGAYVISNPDPTLFELTGDLSFEVAEVWDGGAKEAEPIAAEVATPK